MTEAGFTYAGVDPGATTGRYGATALLENRRMSLVPAPGRRVLSVPSRPGSWDFGSELGERAIDLELALVRSSLSDLDAALAALADLFDPTEGSQQLIFDSLSDRYFLARLVGEPTPVLYPSAARVTLSMRCADPFAYSTALYTVHGGSATLTGFSAYRQAPALGLAWNLVKNGGFNAVVGAEWTLHANASRVVDATSPTGYALRTIATAGFDFSHQSVTVEPGRVYSLAAQLRGDGSAMDIYATYEWFDAGGTQIGAVAYIGSTASTSAWLEMAVANVTAPGHARTLRVGVHNGASVGIFHFAAIRVKQQATAPAAWSSADQQVLGNKGLAIYEASTNLMADGDMEAVGVASWIASNATLVKDSVRFAGAQSLRVQNTAANGSASQTGALAAAQAITASVRANGGDAGTALQLFSTPSNALIGQQLNPNTTTWNKLSVSGVIAAGDTGYRVYLIGGSGAATFAQFDNLAVENKAYDSMNADPSGQAFALAARTASSVTETLPSGFNIADFARVVAVRPDHAYSRVGPARVLWTYYINSTNYIDIQITGSNVILEKVRAGVVSQITDAAVTAFAAGDSLVVGVRHSATVGLELQVSKNGGAVATYTLASAEVKVTLSGTPTSHVGGFGVAGYELDGTFGIDRLLRSGLTGAQVSAIVAAPYAAQDEALEFDVWRFEGAAVQENYASGTLDVDVGGTYKALPTLDITAGAAFGPGNLTVTDESGRVLTWNGSLALNDVLSIETETQRVRKNAALSMSGVVAGSKWPELLPATENNLVVGGIPAASIKALRAQWRNRWL